MVVDWLIKPFTMFGFAWLFLKGIFGPLIEPGLASEYVAGAILLGAAPCTVMVFVWSYLADGDPAHTLVQVAINDLIMLVAFAPIVAFLLGLSDVIVHPHCSRRRADGTFEIGVSRALFLRFEARRG